MNRSHSLSGHPLDDRASQRDALFFLPRYNRIDNILLLAGSFSKVNAGSFNTFVSHEVCQKSNIIVFFKKVLCIAMTERMGINDLFIKPVFSGIIFKLLCDSSCCDSFSKTVQSRSFCLLTLATPAPHLLTRLECIGGEVFRLCSTNQSTRP